MILKIELYVYVSIKKIKDRARNHGAASGSKYRIAKFASFIRIRHGKNINTNTVLLVRDMTII